MTYWWGYTLKNQLHIENTVRQEYIQHASATKHATQPLSPPRVAGLPPVTGELVELWLLPVTTIPREDQICVANPEKDQDL